MSKKTLFLIFALFIITLILVAMAFFQPQNLKTPPAVTFQEPAAQSILTFEKPIIATSSSMSILNYSLPVNISTGINKVTAVQLELQYDPKVLTNVVVTPGTFFPNPVVLLNQTDTKTGRISSAFGVGLTDKAVNGKGNVATITFSTYIRVPTETVIIVLPKTLVTAEETNETVLKETITAPFMIGTQ